ncbi:unnamed protein product [Rhizopus stolonifer]
MSTIPLYYIRFLKPPPIECIIGQPFTIVWTVESDLGDTTYWESLSIAFSLQGTSGLGLRCLETKEKKKKMGIPKANPLSQKLTLAYDPLQGGGTVSRLVIEPLAGPSVVGSVQLGLFLDSTSQAHSVWTRSYLYSSIWVIPTWSRPIQTMVGKQRHMEAQSGDQAERIVNVNKNQVVRICEDAVQSIARHVWDCGLGMCQFMKENQKQLKFKNLLELGSGTGLVGIYAAELLQPDKVYLTDLADALEIMQQNVDLMKTKEIMRVRELSWGNQRQDEYEDVDLILLTDVLYNQSSHDLLLDTLDWLLDNQDAKALLSYKERNPDEREFFEKVTARGWSLERIPTDTMFETYWIFK